MSNIGSVPTGFGALKNKLAEDAAVEQEEAEEHEGYEYLVHFTNGLVKTVLHKSDDLSEIARDVATARKHNGFIIWNDSQASCAAQIDHIDAVLDEVEAPVGADGAATSDASTEETK